MKTLLGFGTLLCYAAFLAPGAADEKPKVELKIVQALTMPKARFTCFEFNPGSGKNLYTGGDDGSVRVWETLSGKELHTFPHEGLLVTCLEFHKYEYLFVGVLERGRPKLPFAISEVRLWNVYDRKEVGAMRGLTAPALDMHLGFHERTLIILSGPRLPIWDLPSMKESGEIKVDGRILAIEPTSTHYALAKDTGEVALYYPKEDRITAELSAPVGQPTLFSHRCMAGGRTLLALGGTTSLQTGDVEIHLWNTYEKRQVLSFGKESNHAVCMVFSKDNDLLFSSHRDDQCIKVWSVKTGVLLFKQRQENLVTRLIRSDDRLYLAGCTQQPASQILIWEMPKIKP